MPELHPFRALRYAVASTDASAVIAPPYDVISPAQQEELYARGPHNIVRLEFGREQGAGRYAAAAEMLRTWQAEGVLTAEAESALYLYEQEFSHNGHTYRRRAVLGRVRLEPLDGGGIRPHEFTMSRPKEDRLNLLRATRANISPVYALTRDESGAFAAALDRVTGTPVADADDLLGHHHRLAVISDPELQSVLAAAVAAGPLYIADGHHRYETALVYRDERRAAASRWTGDEPENFVLMGITAARDPGLLIRPIHRLIERAATVSNMIDNLRAAFDIADAGNLSDPAARAELATGLARRDARSVFGMAGGEPGRLHRLSLRDQAAVEAGMPEGHPAAWRALDVNVLQYGVLQPLYGIDADALAAGAVAFTEDAEEALRSVEDGTASAAFLLNSTRPEDIFAVADAGDRMPQKSTFFYPKLGTGLVINSHDL